MQVKVHPGVTLAVTDVGSHHEHTLVMIHGHGGAKEDFGDYFADLAQTHRVVALDLRGHGESDKPTVETAYSLDIMATDVLAVADALNIDRFDVVGHSMGGMIARRVVLRAPERVSRVVFMNTCAGPLPGYDHEMLELGAQIALTQGLDEIKRVLDAVASETDGPAQRVLRERPGYREYCDEKFTQCSAVMWATMLRELIHQPDELAALASVRQPTLVMVGAYDDIFRAASLAIAQTVPDALYVEFPEAAHSPQFEDPQRWLAALCAFLNEEPFATTDARAESGSLPPTIVRKEKS